jgi:hypothetical protein
MIDPEYWKTAIFGFGIVRDSETGEIRWPVVAGGILVAATVAIGGFLVTLSNSVAAIEARQVLMEGRVSHLEDSAHPATSKRFTSDDAARENELLRTRIRDAREECRRDNDDVRNRVQRLEEWRQRK